MIRSSVEAVKDKLGWETPIQYLKGVGPQRSAFFRRLEIKTLRDLVYHLPRRHEDRRVFSPIAQLVPGQKATAYGRVAGASLFRARTGTLILQVVVRDATGAVTGLWFNQPYMKKWFPIGQEIILYGMLDQIGRKLQMAAPEFELIRRPEEETAGAVPSGAASPPKSLHMGRVVPIYPATSGLHQRELRTAVATALKGLLPAMQDPLPVEIRDRHSLLDLPTALKRAHFPPAPEAIEPAQARLAFDELFCFQLGLGIRRRTHQQKQGIAHQVGGDLVERWRSQLPFQLTPGQEKAIEEIARDMAAPRSMLRLVQGEVGSGKTVVAAYGMVVAVQSGFQAAVLAPTEVLARQHALSLSRLLSGVEIEVRLLTSSLKEQDRIGLGRELEQGTAQVLVGTHAVLEPWVRFKRLGFVVIDEQQKFGVDQRNTLAAKGENPDILILTATPIPRTLALTLYGELEISTITERPAGRQPVRTVWMDSTRREEAYAFVKKELDAGRQAYVVCPRIGKEDSESNGGGGKNTAPLRTELFVTPSAQISAATQVFQEYQQMFAGYKVALLHGRMTPPEQKAIFAAFKQGEIQLLVATQVIEVGVDVANATVMIIEGADRFGLSQLHQLRGRVGRGQHESTCILLADPTSPAGAERLQTVVEVGDAFKIAEEDLRLRGPGELLGKRQAGVPDLKCLQWAAQGPWLELARSEAETLLNQDPAMAAPELTLLRKEAAWRFPELAGPCA